MIFDAVVSGSELYTAAADGLVQCWDWRAGTLLGTAARESSAIQSLAVMQAGGGLERLCVACSDGSVGLWDVRSRSKLGSIAPDSEWSAARSGSGVNAIGWREPQRYHSGALVTTRLAPNGVLLATVCRILRCTNSMAASAQRSAAQHSTACSCAIPIIHRSNRTLPLARPLFAHSQASTDCTCKLWSVLSLRKDTSTVLAFQSRRHRTPTTATASGSASGSGSWPDADVKQHMPSTAESAAEDEGEGGDGEWHPAVYGSHTSGSAFDEEGVGAGLWRAASRASRPASRTAPSPAASTAALPTAGSAGAGAAAAAAGGGGGAVISASTITWSAAVRPANAFALEGVCLLTQRTAPQGVWLYGFDVWCGAVRRRRRQ